MCVFVTLSVHVVFVYACVQVTDISVMVSNDESEALRTVSSEGADDKERWHWLGCCALD